VIKGIDIFEMAIEPHVCGGDVRIAEFNK